MNSVDFPTVGAISLISALVGACIGAYLNQCSSPELHASSISENTQGTFSKHDVNMVDISTCNYFRRDGVIASEDRFIPDSTLDGTVERLWKLAEDMPSIETRYMFKINNYLSVADVSIICNYITRWKDDQTAKRIIKIRGTLDE
jgi:hypothetical protein